MEHKKNNKIESDMHERVIWSKISGGVEIALNSINAQIIKRKSKSIVFKSSGTVLEINIIKNND